MKKPFLFFALCFSLLAAAPQVPSWYYQLSGKSSSYYVGYGQGKSEAEAKTAALHDIAKKISVTVNAEEHRFMNLDENDRLSKGFDSETTQTSSVKIYGYEVLKLEYDDGSYFVALGYDNIPAIEKFNQKLSKIDTTEPEVINRYLQHTPVAKAVNRKVGFLLKRQNDIWYMHYKDIMQPLDTKDFSHFFTTVDNPNLSIATNKRNDLLYNGDEFYFRIISKKSGYVTVFMVYEDGTTSTLIRNVPVKKNKMKNIPDKNFESVLQAGLIEKGVETFDLYVVVYSKNKKHFDNFARADEDLLSDERYKSFDELIELLNDVEFATLKVVTKPRI